MSTQLRKRISEKERTARVAEAVVRGLIEAQRKYNPKGKLSFEDVAIAYIFPKLERVISIIRRFRLYKAVLEENSIKAEVEVEFGKTIYVIFAHVGEQTEVKVRVFKLKDERQISVQY